MLHERDKLPRRSPESNSSEIAESIVSRDTSSQCYETYASLYLEICKKRPMFKITCIPYYCHIESALALECGSFY